MDDHQETSSGTPEQQEGGSANQSASGGKDGGKKKADIKRLLLIGIPMLLAALAIKSLDSEAKILWFEKNSPNHTTARFFRFSGEKERQVRVQAGQRLQVEWEAKVRSGDLYVDILSGNERQARISGSSSNWQTAPDEGRSYRMLVTGEEARGSFTLSWEIED